MAKYRKGGCAGYLFDKPDCPKGLRAYLGTILFKKYSLNEIISEVLKRSRRFQEPDKLKKNFVQWILMLEPSPAKVPDDCFTDETMEWLIWLTAELISEVPYQQLVRIILSLLRNLRIDLGGAADELLIGIEIGEFFFKKYHTDGSWQINKRDVTYTAGVTDSITAVQLARKCTRLGESMTGIDHQAKFWEATTMRALGYFLSEICPDARLNVQKTSNELLARAIASACLAQAMGEKGDQCQLDADDIDAITSGKIIPKKSEKELQRIRAVHHNVPGMSEYLKRLRAKQSDVLGMGEDFQEIITGFLKAFSEVLEKIYKIVPQAQVVEEEDDD